MEVIQLSKFNRIYMLDVVKKEFEKICSELWKKDPPYLKYQDRLIGDLMILDKEGKSAVKLANFEKLVNTNCDLYSINHKHKDKNMRYLYAFYEENIILLTAFNEKDKSDYDKGIKRAKARYKWLMEDE